MYLVKALPRGFCGVLSLFPQHTENKITTSPVNQRWERTQREQQQNNNAMTLYPDLSQSYGSVSYQLPSYFSGHCKGHRLASNLKRENPAALMGTHQTASSLQACLYLNWPSAGLQGAPSRISVRWISVPFCPYQEMGRMSFGTTRKRRNSRPDSQMVPVLSERQQPWKRTDVHYFYNWTMGTDC